MLQNRLIRVLFFVFAGYLIISLSRSIYTVTQKESIVIEEEKRRAEVLSEHKQLSDSLSTMNSSFFIEQQAREKLGLAKPGDVVVIMPPVSPTPTSEPKDETENWYKWFTLYH